MDNIECDGKQGHGMTLYEEIWRVEEMLKQEIETTLGPIQHQETLRPQITNATVETYDTLAVLELNGQQVKRGTYPAIEQNNVKKKSGNCVIPKPLVIVVKLNGHPVRALIDSGSLGDFVSTTTVEQLKLEKIELSEPIPVQLAVQGSRSRINYGAKAKLEYQQITGERYFDVMNLQGYNVILGTPWIYQHKVTFGLNPSRVMIGSAAAVPMIEGANVAKLSSGSMIKYERNLEEIRIELREYAAPLCKPAGDTPLPPLRAINHEIPLIEENKIYPWHPSRCPEALKPQWDEKRAAYVKSGRWEVTAAGNAVPMMFLKKPGKDGEPPRLRIVSDLRARNANTHKKSSPLPDMEGILRRAARAKYRSIIDGQDAYEQIRIRPDHVSRTTMTTPDGNMISHVIQQGDCNAPATYQALMNYLFAPYLGQFLDVYLDDIIIYSNTLEDHVKHIKLVLDILKREKLYLSEQKLQFLCR